MDVVVPLLWKFMVQLMPILEMFAALPVGDGHVQQPAQESTVMLLPIAVMPPTPQRFAVGPNLLLAWLRIGQLIGKLALFHAVEAPKRALAQSSQRQNMVGQHAS
jgi:hypothetical protein